MSSVLPRQRISNGGGEGKGWAHARETTGHDATPLARLAAGENIHLSVIHTRVGEIAAHRATPSAGSAHVALWSADARGGVANAQQGCRRGRAQRQEGQRIYSTVQSHAAGIFLWKAAGRPCAMEGFEKAARPAPQSRTAGRLPSAASLCRAAGRVEGEGKNAGCDVARRSPSNHQAGAHGCSWRGQGNDMTRGHGPGSGPSV